MAYHHDQLTRTIIQCIIKVHRTLGPGFLESIYRKSLLIELQKHELFVETEKEIVIYYDGVEVGRHRLDILIQNSVVVELKTVELLCGAHYAQLRSYMKATESPVGILVNFSKEKADFRRIERLKIIS
jgi:GxxExxY protein